MPILEPRLVTQGAPLLLKVRDEGPRRGSTIEAMLDVAGLPPDDRWAVAFVQYVGHWTHFEHGGHVSAWPIPKASSFKDILTFAEERQIVRAEPLEGDIALVCDRARGTYLQGGFVVDVLGSSQDDPHSPASWDCITIEGNTDLRGGLNGKHVCYVHRQLVPAAGDCFIRWADLDNRGVTAEPAQKTEVVMGRVRFGKSA